MGGLGGRYHSHMAFLHHSPSALGKHGELAAPILMAPFPCMGYRVTKYEKACKPSMNPALFFTIGLYLQDFRIKQCKIPSRLFRYVPMLLAQVVYERGLILQITLLAPELRSKGLRFESKGRRLDGHDDFQDFVRSCP